MIVYQPNSQWLEIRESANEDDIEFRIRIEDGTSGLDAWKDVQHVFEDNDDFTDVLFYPYQNHEYRVIVKHEHYGDFLAELWKRRLLTSLAWKD